MAENLYTSDRLCKVMTQNFREEKELAIRLKDIEVKRKQAMVRIILKSLEVERDIGCLLLPSINKEHIKSNCQKKKEICANSVRGKDKEVDLKLQNEESYLNLIKSPPQPKLSLEHGVDLRHRWNIKGYTAPINFYQAGKRFNNQQEKRRLNFRNSLLKNQ